MKSKSLQRVILLASGICAVLVILLSQSFYQAPHIAKQKTEKPGDKKEVAIQAPSDVAVQGQVVELQHPQTAVVEELVMEDHQSFKTEFVHNTTSRFFKTLFRAFISPNAP